jgi:ABC-2 type transport system permease protein
MSILRLFWSFFRIGALNELQYRANFFVQLLQSALALIVGLVGLGLVFSHTATLAGWAREELLVVMGVHLLMGGLIRATIQPNMERLMNEIQEGAFDFTLAKPADSQTLVSARELRLWQLVEVVVGLIVVMVAVWLGRLPLGLWPLLSFALALILGALIIYAFWLLLTTAAFWVIRMEQVVELFQGVYAAGRWPVSIYPDWLRAGLTLIVPLAFAITVPAEALTARLTLPTLGLAVGFTVAVLRLARWVWFRGLRAYSGASA